MHLSNGSTYNLGLRPREGHPRRSTYARRIFRPAVDGQHQATSRRPGRVLIVDAA